MNPSNQEIHLRSARPEDAEALLHIYAPYVEHTAVTFEYVTPTPEEFRQRITKTLQHYPYLVAEDASGNLLGYAYAGVFKARAAFSHCVETSIYVDPNCHGHGIGRRLYEALETELRKQNILNLNACISWTDTPGEYLTHQSPEFHECLGYRKVGHFHQCGLKFGQWFDVIWMEKMIGPHN